MRPRLIVIGIIVVALGFLATDSFFTVDQRRQRTPCGL